MANSISNSTLSAGGGFETELNIGLGLVELLINLVGIPASALNILLIIRTSLIHTNMKFILLYQSACLLMRGTGRLLVCAVKVFVDADTGEQAEPMRTIYLFGIYNRNFLAHVLIIERIMATVFVKTYEQRRNWLFSALWSPFVFFGALYNIYVMGNSTSTLTNILTNSSLLVLGLLEFLLFIWIWHYNKRIYMKRVFQKVQSLSRKYQLSENIRIGKQLMPALLFHFVCLFMNVLKLYWSQFGVSGYAYLLPITTTLGSFFGLLIEVTTISCHPFLRRDFYGILQRILTTFGLQQMCQNRISDENSAIGGRASCTIAMHDIISGDVITAAARPDQHFELLTKSWEESRRKE